MHKAFTSHTYRVDNCYEAIQGLIKMQLITTIEKARLRTTSVSRAAGHEEKSVACYQHKSVHSKCKSDYLQLYPSTGGCYLRELKGKRVRHEVSEGDNILTNAVLNSLDQRHPQEPFPFQQFLVITNVHTYIESSRIIEIFLYSLINCNLLVIYYLHDQDSC